MTVINFPVRPPTPARSLEQLVARKRSPHPSCDITVTKDQRTRRYLLWSDSPGRWLGQVWFDRGEHRRKRAVGVHDARALALQFARELRDLEWDGWIND